MKLKIITRHEEARTKKRVHVVRFHVYEILENAVSVDWGQLSGCLRWRQDMGHGGTGGKSYKDQEGILGGDGYIHYLGICDGFVSIYTCQMLSNHTLNRVHLVYAMHSMLCAVFCVNYASKNCNQNIVLNLRQNKPPPGIWACLCLLPYEHWIFFYLKHLYQTNQQK